MDFEFATPWRRRFAALGFVLAPVLAAACGDGPVAPLPNALPPSFAIGTDPGTGATIETDKDDYLPGETVQIVGTGWASGEAVHFHLTRDPQTSPDDEWDVTAGADGGLTTSFPVVDSDLGVTFTMTSTGAVSGSVTTVVFTDGIPSSAGLSISVPQNPNPLVVGPSGPYVATYQVRLTFEGNGTACTVALTASETGAPSWPAGASFSFSPTQVTGWGASSPSGPQTSTLSVSVPSGTTSATYNFSVGISYPVGHGCQNTGSSPTAAGTLVVQAPANAAPVLASIGNQSVDEGSELTFTASATDDLAQTLTFSLIGAPAGATINASTGAFSWTPADGPSSATFTVRVTDDGSPNLFDEEEITVTVYNVAPTITSFSITPSVVQVGGAATLNVSFSDPGSADTHTATSSCGGSAGPTSAGATSLAVECTFTTVGIHTVSVTVTDDDLGSDTEEYFGYVVVYDPTAGFVTGGGWIDSPAGAYVPDAGLAGRATFGFVSKYEKGKTVPSGNTEFVFHAAGMNFRSTSYEWLVVSGARAQYKGEGTVNGVAGYGFMLTAIDGQVNGGGGTDKLRLKIVLTATGEVVYDNQMGASDTAVPTTALGGGSIVIHTGGPKK